MNKEKIKSAEFVIIKDILAWQVAQVLGCEDEEDLKKHALLLAVDYDEDSFFTLMTGEYFKVYFNDENIKSWNECYHRFYDKYVEKTSSDILSFFGKDEIKTKWEKGIEFDSIDFVTRNEGIPKSTHAVCNIFERDGHLHSIFWFVEINQYQQSRNALTFLAEHDALTGLYNRHKLDSVIEKLNATQLNRDEIFYILFDLDDFKNINDMYGHSNGDRALAAFAKRLESVFFHKTYNSVFRLGGDEFLVIATHVNEKKLLPFIKDAGETIDVILDDGNTIKVRGSIGYGHELDAADEMLYTVKGNKKSIN